MQPLTAAPRDQWTTAQVTNLLQSVDLQVDFGVELLTPALALTSDISANVSAGVVHRDNLANIHGTVDLTLSQTLAWGYDRVRPYQLLSSVTAGVTGCRWNLGVYLLTTPDMLIGQDPQSYAVTGFDQLYILQNPIGDSYSVAAGANVLAAVRTALTAAGVVAPVLLDSTGSAKVTAVARVWVQDSSNSPTWIGVVNDLLASIGYRGIWADWDGAFRSGPYVLPAARPAEFSLDVGSLVTGIVAEDRTVTNDLWGVANWMRVIRNGMTTRPTEGAGRYTMTNASTGLSSVASVGRTVKAPVVYLDAVSQADLVTQGDRLFAAATRVSEVLTLKLSPMPAMWHADVLTYADAALGADRKVQGRSWSLPLDGSDMDLVVESV